MLYWVINLATTTILFTESLDFSKNSVRIYHFDQGKQLLIFNSGYFIHIVLTKSTTTNSSSSCRASVIHSCLQVSIKQLSDRSEYNATVNLYSTNASVNLYSFMPPPINQPECGYSVRHGAYVRCFNQSARGYGVRHGGVYVTVCTSRCVRTLFDQSARDYSIRHGAYVRCFNQSEHSYGVRHGVYATGYTYAVLTNQRATFSHTN